MPVATTPEQRADAEYVAGLRDATGHVDLDLGDERQYRYVVNSHIASGQTPERYPGLHAALAAGRAARLAGTAEVVPAASDDNGWSTAGYVTGVGITADGRAMGTSFVSMVGEPDSIVANLTVQSPDGTVTYATGTGTGYKSEDGYVPCDGIESPGGPKPPQNGSMVGVLNWTYVVDGRPYSGSAQALGLTVPTPDPVVSAPVKSQSIGHDDDILIGLGRAYNDPNRNKDLDYWYGSATGDLAYKIPLVGTCTFNFPIDYIASITCILSLDGGGTAPLTQDSFTQLKARTTASGSVLQWQMTPPNPPTDEGVPLNFGPLSWSSDMETILWLQVSLVLQGNQPAIVTIRSRSKADLDVPMDGTTLIPRIKFIYHCLAEGTAVRLADGSAVAIEELTKHHTLATRTGDQPVTTTTAGNFRGIVRRLRVEGGERDLLLSHNHVLMTPDGPRQAEELAVDDVVCVEGGGTAPLTVAEDVAYEGRLWNACVSRAEGEPRPEEHTLYANGIEVCDWQVQQSERHRRLADPDWVLARLDPAFHTDYRSALEDRQAAAARR